MVSSHSSNGRHRAIRCILCDLPILGRAREVVCFLRKPALGGWDWRGRAVRTCGARAAYVAASESRIVAIVLFITASFQSGRYSKLHERPTAPRNSGVVRAGPATSAGWNSGAMRKIVEVFVNDSRRAAYPVVLQELDRPSDEEFINHIRKQMRWRSLHGAGDQGCQVPGPRHCTGIISLFAVATGYNASTPCRGGPAAKAGLVGQQPRDLDGCHEHRRLGVRTPSGHQR